MLSLLFSIHKDFDGSVHVPAGKNSNFSSILNHFQGSKAQLEDVWEKNDEMDRDNFNPKTFFMMHGRILVCHN